MNMLPKRRKRLFLVRPRLLWQRHLHAGVAGGAFAATLLFLVLVLLSTSAPSSSPPSLRDSSVVSSGRRSSSSSPPPSVNCDDMTASLGEFGDMMVSMLPKNLAFTVFVPSPESFRRVLKLQRPNDSATNGNGADDDATYAVVSRVLGFSAVPRRLRAADVAPPRHRQQMVAVAPVLESVSGLRISAWRRPAASPLSPIGAAGLFSPFSHRYDRRPLSPPLLSPAAPPTSYHRLGKKRKIMGLTCRPHIFFYFTYTWIPHFFLFFAD